MVSHYKSSSFSKECIRQMYDKQTRFVKILTNVKSKKSIVLLLIYTTALFPSTTQKHY